MALAVAATAGAGGSPAARSSRRISSRQANPSISGIEISIISTSNGAPPRASCAACHNSTASRPSFASSISTPVVPSIVLITSRLVELSSATRARRPGKVSRNGRSSGPSPSPGTEATGRAASGSGSTTRKVVPSPGVLVTPISPPISRVMSRTTARPSPVPPYRAEISAPACRNA